MALTTTPIPYGLRQVMVYPLITNDVAGTKVRLPNARTFSFTDGTDSVELRGDDQVVAQKDTGANVEFELEAGGISLEAWKTIADGTITETGTTPNQKKVYVKRAGHVRPYFGVEGRSISDSGGDFHLRLPVCKATGDLTGELTDQEYWLTGASGNAIASRATSGADWDATLGGVIYEFTQNETAVVIS